MRKLLVTGASGFLGWNICSKASRKWSVTGITFSNVVKIPDVSTLKCDLTNYRDLKRLFSEVQPDSVIHTAAASQPEYCQVNQTESRRINVDVPHNIAGLCADYNISCAFTSTDLVFDGLNPPYGEQDPACPVNVYAEQKVLAEEGMTKRFPETAICRIPLMFGASPASSQSSLQIILNALMKKQKLNLFTDEYRTPISAGTAFSGLLLALENVSGILHLGGCERVSRYELGMLTARIFQKNATGLIPCRSSEVFAAAPRAPDVSLDSSKAKALGFSPLPLKEELKNLKLTL
jgi:dTDP-4-dehydrorhamnose reductase